jgi:hypothetical protein
MRGLTREFAGVLSREKRIAESNGVKERPPRRFGEGVSEWRASGALAFSRGAVPNLAGLG